MAQIFYYISFIGISIIQIIVFLLIIRYIFSSSIKDYHSNWNTLIDGFKFSTKEFYQRLNDELNSNGIDNIRTSEVYLKEGGIFSTKRLYLRVEWKEYQYDVCGAPFGKGFFVSWWLLYKNSIIKSLITKIPFIGFWLSKTIFPNTYYKTDTASMFMSYAQSSVLKVIDDITNEKGIRSLSESERKPIMKDIFKR